MDARGSQYLLTDVLWARQYVGAVPMTRGTLSGEGVAQSCAPSRLWIPIKAQYTRNPGARRTIDLGRDYLAAWHDSTRTNDSWGPLLVLLAGHEERGF